MNVEAFRDYCLTKKDVTESFPFDGKTLVFKVMNKMFALTAVEDFSFINLKCEPEKAIELREKHEGVIPGYHMNKKHWNSVSVKGDISDHDILQWTADSYDLIVSSLSKKLKQELEAL